MVKELEIYLSKIIACLIVVMAIGSSLNAQELRLLNPETVNLIKQEVSGDAAYEHIRHNTQFHRPRGGSEGLMTVAEYYERKAREYGLEDVQLIVQDYHIEPWNATEAELWISGDHPERIASYLQTPLHLADYSAPADVTTELVYVGGGTASSDYDGKNVSGKIVLAHGSLSAVVREAVWERGAEGIVWYRDPLVSGNNVRYPDQIPWQRVPVAGPEGQRSGFAFVLSVTQGIDLRERVVNSAEPVEVHAKVDAAFESAHGEEPWQVMVEAYIRGTNPDNKQDIILTGHMQEEKFSANDDASGTASILEAGRALKKLIDNGKLERPERNIRFWWVTEFSSQRQYFADHPEAHHRMWVNINQDMVGANQAQDVMRTQNITRLPSTRFHFFNDVVESVIDYMVATNTSHLSQLQAGSDFYTKPHLSRLGSNHRYNAEMIWFHGNTDHVPFNEAPIGVPGITFTNWPDNYIHTSDDDLWNIDRTQLGRNSASGALIAWIMASANESSAAGLAVSVLDKGGQRIASNKGLAMAILESDDSAAAYQQAVRQIHYAANREVRAVESIRELGQGADQVANRGLDMIESKRAAALQDLESFYQVLYDRQPPRYRPTNVERRLSNIRPELDAGPAEFQFGRGEIRGVPGLHRLMALEILSAVDSERTGLDIYHLVSAQAREAGSHYYGTVEPEAVLQYLQNAAEVGLISF